MVISEKTLQKLGLKINITGAAIVGLIGGILLGVRETIYVIHTYAPCPFSFSQILSFSLPTIAIYTLIGCLGMIVIGMIMNFFVPSEEDSLIKLLRRYVEIFVTLVVAWIASDTIARIYPEIGSDIFMALEIIMVSILCGVAIGHITSSLLSNEKLKGKRVIPLFISIFISLIIFLYSALWVKKNLSTQFLNPLGLLSYSGLLIMNSLLAIGIYLFLTPIFQKDNNHISRQKWRGLAIAGGTISLFIIFSLVVYFKGKSVTFPTSTGKIQVDYHNKPNIIWIVADGLRADHLSCNGYYRQITPNIDKIAKEGILFENAFTTSNWTVPTHASMFTGMYPITHGTGENHRWLDDKFYTLAEVLKSYGYNTFGYSNSPFICDETNLIQGFNTFITTSWGKDTGALENFLMLNSIKQFFMKDKDTGAFKTNKVVSKWITDSLRAKTPFFIFINYMETHSPHGDTPYFNHYLKKGVKPQINQDQYAYISGSVKMDNKDFETLKALYDGDILYLDMRIGQLIDYLRELNVLDETILIINSDHGENLGEHNLIKHSFSLYDTLLHVPLIIRYPKISKGGLRIKNQVQIIDIFPTILDILKIKWEGEKNIQGISLFKRMKQLQSMYIIAEQEIPTDDVDRLKSANNRFDVFPYACSSKIIRTEEFKYIWISNGKEELYNVADDPAELNNLIATYPEKKKELKTALKTILSSFENYRSTNGLFEE